MFTPTQQELEELGFQSMGYKFTLMFDGMDLVYSIGWELETSDNYCRIYPQSIDDIKTLIKLFTAP